MRSAQPIACAPEAQAELTAKEGPRRPWRIDSAPAPALLIISGTDSGETYWPPRSRSVSWPSTSVRDAADAGAEHAADALGGRRAAPCSQPASASASAQAPIASCVKRSARRASLAERNSVGSKSAQRPHRRDAAHAGAPALVQRTRADAERRDRTDPGDDDRLHPRYRREHQLDGVVDGLDLGDIGALELDAELLVRRSARARRGRASRCRAPRTSPRG